MKVKGKKYQPIGNGLGYCLGGSIFRRSVFYFKGYPQIPYDKCEIVELKNADPGSFESDTVMGEGKDKNNKYFQGKIVIKGKGQRLNQDWEFIPMKGIKCQTTEIFFGTDRTINRSLLGNEQEFNFARTLNEDSYQEFQNTETWIRLTYDETDRLDEIEFLQGSLRINQIKLLGTRQASNELAEKLAEMKFELERQEDYWISKESKFTFSSSEDMGGDTQQCVYFYTANEIGHLLND